MHAGLALALSRWIAKHPDDHRYILTNGYDWTYFTVDDVPYFVRGIRLSGGVTAQDEPAQDEPAQDEPELLLSDGSEERFPDAGYRIGRGGALYCPVKGGSFEARFTPGAQAALGELLEEDAGGFVLRVGARRVRLPGSDPGLAP